jgi:uncharacterized protein
MGDSDRRAPPPAAAPPGGDPPARGPREASGPRRFRGLPRQVVAGQEVPVAVGFRARLLGLAYLDFDAAGPGLLIPRCAAVHTFGMRFALDLWFLDGEGEVLAVRRAVPPRRLVSHRGAAAVLEIPAPSA